METQPTISIIHFMMEELLANNNPLRRFVMTLIKYLLKELYSLPVAKSEEFYFEKINSAKESLEWELRRSC